MSDEKLREELFYIVKFSERCDFTDKNVVNTILTSQEASEVFTSVFGKRFLNRIINISRGKDVENTCIICGSTVKKNKVVCKSCTKRIVNSDYAKNKIGIKQKARQKVAFKFRWDLVVMVCLIVILLFQCSLLYMFNTIPDINPLEEARISAYELTAAENEEQAMAIVNQEFPEDQGWSIRYLGKSDCFAGYFAVENGQCCDDVAENLPEEERYDFFWGIEDYQFIVSYNVDNVAKMGIVEVNDEGHVLVKGAFNDGRDADKYYKIK